MPSRAHVSGLRKSTRQGPLQPGRRPGRPLAVTRQRSQHPGAGMLGPGRAPTARLERRPPFLPDQAVGGGQRLPCFVVSQPNVAGHHLRDGPQDLNVYRGPTAIMSCDRRRQRRLLKIEGLAENCESLGVLEPDETLRNSLVARFGWLGEPSP